MLFRVPPATTTEHNGRSFADYLYVASSQISGLNNGLWGILRAYDRDSGKLQWRGRVDGTEVVETKEPLTSRWQRFMAFLLKIVPEQQL